jgi:MFS family permease
MITEKLNAADVIRTESAASPPSTSVDHAVEHTVDEVIGRDFTVSNTEIPKGYFCSFSFLGSMFAIGIAFGCGVGGFTLAAPILTVINADIGPDANIIWVSLSYLLTTSIGLIIVGRVSDIFGRCWWFIGGCAIGTLGCIVASVSPNVPALIAAETLIGIGGSVQISYACQFYGIVTLFELQLNHSNSYC